MRQPTIGVVLLLLIGVANSFFSLAAGPMDDAKEAIALGAKCGPDLRVNCVYEGHVQIAAVIVHYFDFAIIIPVACFAILSACLKMRYGNYYVPFSVIVSFSWPLAAMYIVAFSIGYVTESFLREVSLRFLRVLVLSPQTIVLLIAGAWAVARFHRAETLSKELAVVTVAVAVLGHWWTRTVLSGL